MPAPLRLARRQRTDEVLRSVIQVVDILVASLTLDSTPVPRKIARLSLISDILHNSSASIPNAWVYRSTFERKLPQVFDHLGDIYLSFPGRMKAEQFKMQVVNVRLGFLILFPLKEEALTLF